MRSSSSRSATSRDSCSRNSARTQGMVTPRSSNASRTSRRDVTGRSSMRSPRRFPAAAACGCSTWTRAPTRTARSSPSWAQPGAVAEAAFRGAVAASELIDMSKHQGAHPRMGALDVCPIVPVSGVTMDECVETARALGRRLAEALALPVYFYEYAATRPERRNLADIRAANTRPARRSSAIPPGSPTRARRRSTHGSARRSSARASS